MISPLLSLAFALVAVVTAAISNTSSNRHNDNNRIGAVASHTRIDNGLGQRVRKSGVDSIVTSSQLLMLHDEAGQLLGEYDNLGRARWEYVWLNDQPLALVRFLYNHDNPTPTAVEVLFIETDHLHTPRRLTDANRAARWTWDSAPFGDTLPNEAPTAGLQRVEFHLRFAGQYYDIETGLLHNGFRDYDSTSGRYIQSDPIGIAGGVNPYLYANGNPLSFVDPLGLMACEGAKPPFVSDGATLDKLTPDEITRIQNAANRTGTEISVVGSRVNPNKTLHSGSDYDYVINANNKARSSLKSSLPGSKNVGEGTASQIDIFNTPLNKDLPYVTFFPK